MNGGSLTNAEAVARYRTLVENLLKEDSSFERQISGHDMTRTSSIHAAQHEHDSQMRRLEETSARVKKMWQETVDFAEGTGSEATPPQDIIRFEDSNRIDNERERLRQEWEIVSRDHAQLEAIQRFDDETRSSRIINRVLLLMVILTPTIGTVVVLIRAALMYLGG
ncbi:hypothetical protein QDX21_03110 [Auritidibacter ignavus]|uniref:Uncharacterized protein n=2 Tax=Auritidibacter ignavus TaxID=678932 RepID=A0AAJ6AJG5_9MICC|nr:hypothetical protein [Auritidibacter ignavus]WGH93802.1 hypothetical protein QDX21_03110 [Auritidibacter ignavus]